MSGVGLERRFLYSFGEDRPARIGEMFPWTDKNRHVVTHPVDEESF